MIEKFLKAKHWQLFLLIFGTPFIIQIFTMGSVIAYAIKDKEQEVLNSFMLVPFTMIIYTASLFSWYYSVALGLQTKIPAGITMKIKKFKTFFYIPLIYIVIILAYIFPLATGGSQNHFILIIIFPMHILSMVAIAYTMYFVAKTIKTVELQKEVRFSDFVAEFFLVWFYPIGIWMVQPKINEWMEEKRPEEKKSFITRY